ncbi:Hypothetical predicted protein [Cloeon dipterum]|uniref:Ku domain-containing protein n=1 Tax=Cloeon dipterum TaxID=197152 RepID=A0A8S1CR15_9INSE|nr:Hypothetical predicted protein [Cloeon dipterum]
MSRNKPNLVFIIWDIGHKSNAVAPDGQSYFDLQKKCINKIISAKVLFEPKDQVALLKYATIETEHPGDMDTFPNIHFQCDFDTDKIKIMDAVDATAPTDIEQEFLGAFCVALTVLKDRVSSVQQSTSKSSKAKASAPYESLKIILLSRLVGEYTNAETKSITKHLKKIKGLDCSLFVIGPTKKPELEELEEEENLDYFAQYPDSFNADTALSIIFKYVNGVYWCHDEALLNLSSTTSKKVSPRNSKILLELGTDFKIKVQYFNEVCEEPRLEFKVLNSADITKKTSFDRAYSAKGGKRKIVEEEEVIKGFKFGTSIIPFSEEDKSAMEYKSGLPCLKILGFCKKRDIPPIMHIGNTTVNVFPVQNDQASIVAFKALVHTMHQMGRVAVVRRVVMNNGKLTLAALMPRILPDDERLICVELPFANDVTSYKFPRSKPQVSEEQLKAVRDLVQNMNLMDAAADGNEAFQARSTPNPIKIYANELVIQKHRSPDSPVDPPSKFIVSLLEPPKVIAKRAGEMEERLKDVFNIAQVRASSAKFKFPRTPKANTKTMQSEDDILEDQSSQDNVNNIAQSEAAQPGHVKIVQVGSVTPAEDFLALVQQGVPLIDICQQCQTIILQLAVRAQNDLHKPLTAVRVMRQACAKDNPLPYNEWLPQFRNELSERNKLGLWLLIMDENLGPITVEENPQAVMKRDEAVRFLAEPPKDQESQKMDIDSLLEDM